MVRTFWLQTKRRSEKKVTNHCATWKTIGFCKQKYSQRCVAGQFINTSGACSIQTETNKKKKEETFAKIWITINMIGLQRPTWDEIWGCKQRQKKFGNSIFSRMQVSKFHSIVGFKVISFLFRYLFYWKLQRTLKRAREREWKKNNDFFFSAASVFNDARVSE